MKKHLASLSKGQALQVNTRQTKNTKNMSPINIQTTHSRLTIAAGIAGRATGGPGDINEDTVFHKDGVTTLFDAMGGGAPLNETIITGLKIGLSLDDVVNHSRVTNTTCRSHTCLNQIHVKPLSSEPNTTPLPRQLTELPGDEGLDEGLKKAIYNRFRTCLDTTMMIESEPPISHPLFFTRSLNADLKKNLKARHFDTLDKVRKLLDIFTHHHNEKNKVHICVGFRVNPQIHTTQLIAQAGETLITSSDGILDNLTPEQISTIYQACGTPDEFVQTIDRLVQNWGEHQDAYFADINPLDPTINLDTMTIDYPLDTYPQTVILPNEKPLTFVKPPKQDNLSLAVEQFTQDSQITIQHAGDCASILIGLNGSVKYVTKQDSVDMRFRAEEQAEFLSLIEAHKLPGCSNDDLEMPGFSDTSLDMLPPMIEGGTDKKHTSDQDTTEGGHAKKAKR